MGRNYGSPSAARSRSPEAGWYDRCLAALTALRPNDAFDMTGIQLSRLINTLLVGLLLAFGAVYKLSGDVYAFWPEALLAAAMALTLIGSFRSGLVQRRYEDILQAFCYLTAAWFIFLAARNGFDPTYAVGLLFIIPGIGVGYGVVAQRFAPLAAFFAVCAGVSSALCYAMVGPGATALLFVASLICISFVTMFVAAGWLAARKKYRASEQRYRAVVEQSSDGIYLLDAATNTFLDANRAFCEMAGVTVGRLQGMTVEELFLPIGDESTSSHGAEDRVAERHLLRSDGALIAVELRINRIAHAGGDIHSVLVHDIQARKEYEERLLRAKESAEEIANFKSSLLTNMSHELRTPLSSILGWAAVLTDEVPDRHRELVGLIKKSGQRLHHTLDSVIELAHLHANAKTLRPALVDVKDVVVAVSEDMRAHAEAKGLEMTIECLEDAAWAEVDPACFRRILIHVLDNAVKFTDFGSVSVKMHRTGDEIGIAVTDTGEGISEAFLPSIFEEFKQESAGLSRDHEGNGLGLAIAQRLAELLSGRIDVQTERGVGSTFTILIPAAHQRIISEGRRRERQLARTG